jgi:hypothetical protein
VVELLPSKCEALVQTPVPSKNKTKTNLQTTNTSKQTG